MAEGDLGRAMRTGTLDPNIPQRQTSLIVDPPNGLLPPLTAEGKRRALAMRSGWALPGENHTYDGPQDFDSWDRCITRGMPSSMMPYRYNGGFRILQAPGYVVFQLEMIHEARVIPTDGRAPLAAEIKQYLGESRGRWEGNTLVVETTNYKEGPPLINLAVVGSPPGNRFPYSGEMKTTERIVRLNDDWWLYEITTEDPVVLTRPFTVRYPMTQRPGVLDAGVRVPRGQHDRPELRADEPPRARESDADPRGARRGVARESPTRSRDAGSAGRESPRSTSTSSSSSPSDRTTLVVGTLIGTTLGEIGRPLQPSASRSARCDSSCRTGNRGASPASSPTTARSSAS